MQVKLFSFYLKKKSNLWSLVLLKPYTLAKLVKSKRRNYLDSYNVERNLKLQSLLYLLHFISIPGESWRNYLERTTFILNNDHFLQQSK